MSQLGRLVFVAAALGLVGVAFTSCEHVTGPPLSAVIESERLISTSTQANAASICCCRVEGVVRNTSTIPVDISLRWKAVGADGKQFPGTALDFLIDVPPGGRAPFLGVGLFEACSRIVRVERDILVIGHFSPPPQ